MPDPMKTHPKTTAVRAALLALAWTRLAPSGFT
jgi:hypothetical protein